MATTRLLSKTLISLFLLALLFAPSALAAESISPARAIGNEKLKTTSVTTSATKPSGGSKEALSVSTLKPGNGQTVSGSLAWEVAVLSGSPTKVEFAVDGSVKFTDTSAPYGGALDTTKLANGNHTLAATAYGSRGVKAATQVTVKVANAALAPVPAPTPEPEPTPETGNGQPLYWGATIGSQLTGGQAPWDMTAVSKFEELAKKKVSMVQFFMPFANCSPTCTYYPFPKTPLENVRLHGAIPVLSWSSASIPSSLNESNFQLSDVINGTYDSYIRSFATSAKAWGHPFFLRFNWEMNGNWFSWSEGVNGNRSGEYVAAWRHVHDIFSEVGVTNATWVWCPNVDPTNSFQNLASLYPGNAYVDWTALDGYNWGTNPAKPGGWQTFDQIYRSTYKNIISNIAPTKPMLIGEVASSEYGGSKAAWIHEMLAELPREYPAIRGLLWFDHYTDNMDWPIETSSSSAAAFAEGIQSSDYVGNTFGELTSSAIQPLA
jgi:hypothetical protein